MYRGKCTTTTRTAMGCCPKCNKWYAKNTMVVIDYGQSNQTEVCVDCYEEFFFIPPEPLPKGESLCQK